MNPFVLILAILRRHRLITLLFVAIVALSIALGTAVLSQEQALRRGTTTAANKFDLIVGAPGSALDLLLGAVYLQPRDLELLEGQVLAEIGQRDDVEFVAPLAFGDNYRGFPVVGSTAEFVDYLAEGSLAGRGFETLEEAIAGIDVPLEIGDRFEPVHGHLDWEASAGAASTEVPLNADGLDADGLDADTSDINALLESLDATHQSLPQQVVGRLPRTGTPWDRALITPVESVWAIHNLPTGHDPSGPRAEAIGPPFEAEFLTGVPALIVKPKGFGEAYALRSDYRSDRTTAFFPAEVLLELYAIMGDGRAVLSFLALMTQVLVLLGIFAGILALMQLFRKQFGVLRAIGAPRLYLFAVLWGFLALLISLGSVLGLGLGWGLASALSALLSRRTGVAIAPGLGGAELLSAARFALLGYGLALIPSAILYRQPTLDHLNDG